MSYLIATALNNIIWVLTPIQKWQAAGRFKSDTTSQNWLIYAGISAIVIFAIALFVVSFKRNRKRNKDTDQQFFSRAEKTGLSKRQCQILLYIARLAGLKQYDSIFTMSRAFDSGADTMLQEGPYKPQTPEQTKQLRAELFSLREKLGFRSTQAPASSNTPQKLSSRQIPVGKKIYLTRRTTSETEDLEATVVKNDEMVFAAQLPMSIENVKGELWQTRYFFGASVWEFDVSVQNCDGDILTLGHTDDIRFVNRRRFLRVPVKKKGLIASFQFQKVVDSAGKQSESSDGQNTSHLVPDFESAVVTEMAGPGLRIESALGVEVGQRVLVVFDLESENDEEKSDGSSTTKVIEDVGLVRHIRNTPNGFSIAVEMTELDDSEINELIRATNSAATKTNGKNKKKQEDSEAEEKVAEPVSSAGA